MTDPAPPTAQDIRDIYPTAPLPEGKYSDDLLDALVAAFVQQVVVARGAPPWPVDVTVRATVAGDGSVLVPCVPLQSVSAIYWRSPWADVTTASTVVGDDLLGAVNEHGIDKMVGRVLGFGAPCGSVATLTVRHGPDEAPADALVVCAEYVRKRAKEFVGNKPRQARPTEDGQGFDYANPQPDPKSDRWTGIPTVDTAIAAWPDYRIPGIA